MTSTSLTACSSPTEWKSVGGVVLTPSVACRASKPFSGHTPLWTVLFGDVAVVNSDLECSFHRTAQVDALAAPYMGIGSLFLDVRDVFPPNHPRQARAVSRRAAPRRRGADSMIRLLERGIPMAVLRQFTSVFTMTGKNMGAKPSAIREIGELQASAPS